MFGIASFSQAPFSSLAGRTLEAAAQITADATVSASGTRFRTSAASISGQALTLFCWLKTTMRTVPTIVYYDSAGTVSKITGIASNTGQTNGVSLNDVQISDSGIQFRAYDIAYYGFGLAFTASAEL